MTTMKPFSGVRCPAEDPDWREYPNTVLRFVSLGVEVNLTQPVTDEARSALLHGFPRSFGIVTANDPGGIDLHPAANSRRLEELKEVACREGVFFLPVTGAAVNGNHREEGIAVVTSRDTALRFAEEFGQTAIFWFNRDTGVFWLVPVYRPQESVPLPR